MDPSGIRARSVRRQRLDLDRGGARRHEQTRSRIVELIAQLPFRERGVHRRDRCTHAPGAQHRSEERDRVRQHDRHHVAAPDPARGELLGARRGPPFEAAVAELFGHVAHGGPCGPGRGAPPRQVVEAGIRAPCRDPRVEFVERHRRSPPRADGCVGAIRAFWCASSRSPHARKVGRAAQWRGWRTSHRGVCTVHGCHGASAGRIPAHRLALSGGWSSFLGGRAQPRRARRKARPEPFLPALASGHDHARCVGALRRRGPRRPPRSHATQRHGCLAERALRGSGIRAS